MLVTLALSGCSQLPLGSAPPPTNLRVALLEAAKRGDPEFPDGRSVQLTHFSHVGELRAADGQRIFVVDQRAVLTGMLAPLGQNRIAFFDENLRYLGSIGYVFSRPLWCEGSQLYLFGDLDGVATGFEGNVIDVTHGFPKIQVYHESVYGSSGGIEDAPWNVDGGKGVSPHY